MRQNDALSGVKDLRDFFFIAQSFQMIVKQPANVIFGDRIRKKDTTHKIK